MRSTTTAALLSLCLLVATVGGAHAQTTTSYFGPSKALVGQPSELPIPGVAYAAPILWMTAQWFVGDSGYHPTTCVVLLDGYGSGLSSQFVEVPTALAYSSLYSAWHTRTHMAIAWSVDNPSTCQILMASGECLQVSGHTLSYPDVFGATWIADSVAYSTCP